ncbi:DNA-3-methyladenine glycosylase [Streptomyces sp. SS8]
MSADHDRKPLPSAFFDRPVPEAAPDLLGRVLVRMTDDGPVEVRLTEAEAYAGRIGPEPHAYRGSAERNAAMSGPPGRAYTHFTYGVSRRSA